ncbi:Uncharacterised protein [Acinetobacter baumannii]|nr:Uncharacterised protein [Acinetobacter baumannii]
MQVTSNGFVSKQTPMEWHVKIRYRHLLYVLPDVNLVVTFVIQAQE